ncbi:hypothetical protein HNR42_002782 [Deinobacterium chartae]|uniref:Uncharacterized protein n=1 Tax=Deinobacterium chartae TaxID=521158 RepID=A0A841I0M6_9DEIO|nr:hypothetical protein [Deinobacterium chartae]MBB6099341.1 hypothetical protein [Deinobacterium chartae]
MLEPAHSRYVAGQVWSYHTRPGEEESVLRVLKAETHRTLGTIVHVSLEGLDLRGPGGTPGSSIGHLPFAEQALEASVTELLGHDPYPHGDGEGYRIWRDAFERGEAGVWTLPVAEALSALEQAWAGVSPA